MAASYGKSAGQIYVDSIFSIWPIISSLIDSPTHEAVNGFIVSSNYTNRYNPLVLYDIPYINTLWQWYIRLDCYW